MNGNTAVVVHGADRLAVMVRSATSVHVYWHSTNQGTPSLRLRDLSGSPSPRLLDGTGVRIVDLAVGQSSAYVEDLLPGHLYAVELGTVAHGEFRPYLASGPVQTPWIRREDRSDFPLPYHRS